MSNICCPSGTLVPGPGLAPSLLLLGPVDGLAQPLEEHLVGEREHAVALLVQEALAHPQQQRPQLGLLLVATGLLALAAATAVVVALLGTGWQRVNLLHT